MRKTEVPLMVLLFLGVAITSSCVGPLSKSFVTTISASEITDGAEGETMVRIHLYMKQTHEYPENLSVLPVRQGYANRITDGWQRPLIYYADANGIITLKSLGRDGKQGGDGLDQDIIKQYRTKNTDGTLNIDDVHWIVTAEIRAK